MGDPVEEEREEAVDFGRGMVCKTTVELRLRLMRTGRVPA